MNKWDYKALLEESAFNGVFPSIDRDGCSYRKTFEANCISRCAIGLLIPDELYDVRMEFKNINDLVEEYPELEEYIKVDGLSIKDLRDIQNTHDKFDDFCKIWNPNEFIEDLNNLPCFKDDNEI